MKTDTPRRLCFGEFELDSRAGKLYRGGHPVKIQPQPLRVLTILAERPGEIVSREELHSRVWGSSTFVEFDQGLNYCVRQIRLALSDQAAKPQYLETLPKQGYRFIATVNGSHEEPVDPAPVLEAAQPRRRLLLASSALALCVIAALAIWWIARQNLTTGWQLVRQTKLTFFPGDERDPAFSPDGRSIAFSWTGEQGNNRDIYLMPIGSSHTPNRLTRDAAVDMAPAWSPDGSQIAFLRMIAISRGNLVVVPAGGGPERVIHEVRLKDDFYRSMRPLLTWTPDGTGIAYTAQGDESEKANIYLTDLQGRARKLFEADEASLGATGPAFSRDGKSLAYILVYGPPSFTRVVVRSLTPGYKASERQVLGPSGKDVSSPVWTADAGRLIFAQRSGIFAWEPGTNARQIYNGAALDGMSAAWGPRGSLRIVTSEMARTELRTVPLHPGGLAAAGDAVPFAPASATYQSGPQYSPDGKYVVFHGDRSGAFDIWLARVDGTNTQRLTHLNSLDTGFPRWSPDSKRVAFHSFAASKPQIFLVDVEQALAGAEHALPPGPTTRNICTRIAPREAPASSEFPHREVRWKTCSKASRAA